MNGTWLIKSGTDFRNFTFVTLDFSTGFLQVDAKLYDVTSEYEPDAELENALQTFTGMHQLIQSVYILAVYVCH